MAEARKPRFKRQESWRLKRLPEAWRRPRGGTNRMRKEKSGWPPKVKVGYGSSANSRGLHPRGLSERLVEKVSDLDGLDPKAHIVRLSRRLGERKRLVLLEKAKQLNLHVANPGRGEAGTAVEEAVVGAAPAHREKKEGKGQPIVESETEEAPTIEESDS